MVKIKRKVEMTLSELIEWGLENGIKSKRFASNRLNTKYVGFDSLGGVCFNGLYSYLQQDTFTVEVEENITKNTKLKSVLELYTDIHYPEEIFSTIQKDVCINNIINSNPDFFITKYLYLINEDKPPTLIWKDGELVGDE